MRITGGQARGIVLDAGSHSGTRPATDRMREAVFSSLGGLVADVRFFDLFAGSGAYGLEAWSRGAEGGMFVEKHRSLVRAIEKNAQAVSRSLGRPLSQVQVIAGDVLKWKPSAGERPGLIFVDPPYEEIPVVAPKLFLKFEEWLLPGGVIVFEMPGGSEIAPDGWGCFKRLGKGRHQPSCCLYRRVEK